MKGVEAIAKKKERSSKSEYEDPLKKKGEKSSLNYSSLISKPQMKEVKPPVRPVTG